MSPVLDDTLSVYVRTVGAHGSRSAAALPVPFGRLRAWRRLPGPRPADPAELAATLPAGAMEWNPDRDETVVVDLVRNARTVGAALGHLDEAHTCADCAAGRDRA